MGTVWFKFFEMFIQVSFTTTHRILLVIEN
jgi:hypothetical protein